jgi:hypothetical protein
MAILNMDNLVAGLTGGPAPFFFLKTFPAPEAAGIHASMHLAPGIPGAAVAPSPGVNGAALTSYAGQIPFPAITTEKCYLARLSFGCTMTGSLSLYDRLWHNSGLTVTTTTEQSITTPSWPARDRDGSVNGVGVLVGIEVSTATTNGSAVTNTTLNYTNSAGVSGRTATMASFPATAVAGTFVPFLLQAGDVGVRSIQGVTLGTSYGGGAIHLVAYRVLGIVSVNVANGGGERDALELGLPECYADTVPFLLFMPSSSAVGTLQGSVKFAVN